MCKSEDKFGKLILSFYWVGPAIPTQVARLGGKCFSFIHFIHLVGSFSSKKKLVGIKILEVESVVKELILFRLLELGYLPSTKQEFTFLPAKCLLVRPSLIAFTLGIVLTPA